MPELSQEYIDLLKEEGATDAEIIEVYGPQPLLSASEPEKKKPAKKEPAGLFDQMQIGVGLAPTGPKLAPTPKRKPAPEEVELEKAEVGFEIEDEKLGFEVEETERLQHQRDLGPSEAQEQAKKYSERTTTTLRDPSGEIPFFPNAPFRGKSEPYREPIPKTVDDILSDERIGLIASRAAPEDPEVRSQVDSHLRAVRAVALKIVEDDPSKTAERAIEEAELEIESIQTMAEEGPSLQIPLETGPKDPTYLATTRKKTKPTVPDYRPNQLLYMETIHDIEMKKWEEKRRAELNEAKEKNPKLFSGLDVDERIEKEKLDKQRELPWYARTTRDETLEKIKEQQDDIPWFEEELAEGVTVEGFVPYAMKMMLIVPNLVTAGAFTGIEELDKMLEVETGGEFGGTLARGREKARAQRPQEFREPGVGTDIAYGIYQNMGISEELGQIYDNINWMPEWGATSARIVGFAGDLLVPVDLFAFDVARGVRGASVAREVSLTAGKTDWDLVLRTFKDEFLKPVPLLDVTPGDLRMITAGEMGRYAYGAELYSGLRARGFTHEQALKALADDVGESSHIYKSLSKMDPDKAIEFISKESRINKIRRTVKDVDKALRSERAVPPVKYGISDVDKYLKGVLKTAPDSELAKIIRENPGVAADTLYRQNRIVRDAVRKRLYIEEAKEQVIDMLGKKIWPMRWNIVQLTPNTLVDRKLLKTILDFADKTDIVRLSKSITDKNVYLDNAGVMVNLGDSNVEIVRKFIDEHEAMIPKNLLISVKRELSKSNILLSDLRSLVMINTDSIAFSLERNLTNKMVSQLTQKAQKKIVQPTTTGIVRSIVDFAKGKIGLIDEGFEYFSDKIPQFMVVEKDKLKRELNGIPARLKRTIADINKPGTDAYVYLSRNFDMTVERTTTENLFLACIYEGRTEGTEEVLFQIVGMTTGYLRNAEYYKTLERTIPGTNYIPMTNALNEEGKSALNDLVYWFSEALYDIGRERSIDSALSQFVKEAASIRKEFRLSDELLEEKYLAHAAESDLLLGKAMPLVYAEIASQRIHEKYLVSITRALGQNNSSLLENTLLKLRKTTKNFRIKNQIYDIIEIKYGITLLRSPDVLTVNEKLGKIITAGIIAEIKKQIPSSIVVPRFGDVKIAANTPVHDRILVREIISSLLDAERTEKNMAEVEELVTEILLNPSEQTSQMFLGIAKEVEHLVQNELKNSGLFIGPNVNDYIDDAESFLTEYAEATRLDPATARKRDIAPFAAQQMHEMFEYSSLFSRQQELKVGTPEWLEIEDKLKRIHERIQSFGRSADEIEEKGRTIFSIGPKEKMSAKREIFKGIENKVGDVVELAEHTELNPVAITLPRSTINMLSEISKTRDEGLQNIRKYLNDLHEKKPAGWREKIDEILNAFQSVRYGLSLSIRPDYHVINLISGPLITWMTLGGKAAQQSIYNSYDAMKVMNGRGNTTIAFTDPQGRAWTYHDLWTETIGNNQIASRMNWQFGKNDLDEILDFVENTMTLPGATKKKFVQILKDDFIPDEASKRVDIISPAPGLRKAGDVANIKAFDYRNMTLADATDNVWRISAFITSLKAGEGVDTALGKARKSLMDYSELEDISAEKWVSRHLFMFWSFFRLSATETLTNLVKHPDRVANALIAKRDTERILFSHSSGGDPEATRKRDLRTMYQPDWIQGSIILDQTFEDGQYYVTSPGIPQLEGFITLVTFLSSPWELGELAKRFLRPEIRAVLDSSYVRNSAKVHPVHSELLKAYPEMLGLFESVFGSIALNSDGNYEFIDQNIDANRYWNVMLAIQITGLSIVTDKYTKLAGRAAGVEDPKLSAPWYEILGISKEQAAKTALDIEIANRKRMVSDLKRQKELSAGSLEAEVELREQMLQEGDRR